MYQVRLTKSGACVYCLVHLRATTDRGLFESVVESIMPLPVDPDHPMPPFIEGQDVPEEYILYGYKPYRRAKEKNTTQVDETHSVTQPPSMPEPAEAHQPTQPQ